MQYAACIGSAGLAHFTELNICLMQACFGKETPIVVRDDRSTESHLVEQVAAKHDCYYACNDTPLGHFAGDIQAFIDALALAEQVGADVAIKISQRAMVSHPGIRAVVEHYFERNPDIDVLMPGRPNARKIREGHKQFARFPCLTDIVFMRASKIQPAMIKEQYEDQVRNGQRYHDSFVEVFWDKMRNQHLGGRVLTIPEITDHEQGRPCFYLRRYQNRPEEYESRARRFGIAEGPWVLGERAKMVKGYNPRPRLT